ncbi:MAG: hypothetical protein IPH75_15795 [bacterium]|nr:hypothetical protein [bacterium]
MLLFVTSAAWLAMAQNDSAQTISNDPILNYYWKRADATLTTADPNQRGISYSFLATSYYKEIRDEGAVAWVDSVKTAYFYSFGKLDSSVVRRSPSRKIRDVRLDYVNVFHDRYYLNDFPNDTGGASLAIGFDTDTTQPKLPTGIALIDRTSYFPRWLYLHYAAEPGYRRFTRSFRFTVQDGMVFPDSIWEVATQDGLFYSTSYRMETRFDSLTIYR